MRERPKISIITPSYNQGEFLEDCIKSVLMQNYKNFEYIIIDGGSTDNSVEIIKSYEEHLTYWVSEQDGGQSDAINKGFKLATGDIVAWLNSDDFYYQGAFKCIKDQFMENPDASFYYGNGARVDRNGEVKSDFYPGGTPEFNLDALIYGLNYILQPVTFLNRECLQQAGYVDQSLNYGMDGDLWVRMAKLCPPQRVDQILAATREYGNTKTSTGSFERVEELRLISYKYSGCSITPGALLYYIDTLNNYLSEAEQPFQPWFKSELVLFWQVVAENFRGFNAGADGTPLSLPDPGSSDRSAEAVRKTLLEKDRLIWQEHNQKLTEMLEVENRKVAELTGELTALKEKRLIRLLMNLKLV